MARHKQTAVISENQWYSLCEMVWEKTPKIGGLNPMLPQAKGSKLIRNMEQAIRKVERNAR